MDNQEPVAPVTPVPINYYFIFHDKAFKPRCGTITQTGSVVIFVSADEDEVTQLESMKCVTVIDYEEYANAMDMSGGTVDRSLGKIKKGISEGLGTVGQSMVNAANKIRR